MPKNKPVVSDTSPLLNLAFIDRLQLLEKQFGEVKMPRQVWNEVLEGQKGVEKLENLKNKGFLQEVEVEEDGLFHELFKDLDRGESAAIKYAVENNADMILLDEKEARQTARRHDLETTGVIGVLLKAHKKGNTDLKDELEKLKSHGFYISNKLEKQLLDQTQQL